MFRGRYEYGVDTKGRLAIQSKFREVLGAKFDERL
ncbi:MAG TPA: division/cell wall cluster transcriptional repressor MraZ, partial [Candidatus Omnitrophota bacterium]|nr:division/cell wall cluster transcriptional repressor MraZ [Candidatus Omnitrophota bacterium]